MVIYQMEKLPRTWMLIGVKIVVKVGRIMQAYMYKWYKISRSGDWGKLHVITVQAN